MHIALAGEALIDFTASGPLAFQGHEGGGILNSAVACARLGQPTAFLTQLSTDLFGERLLQFLQANGLDTSLVTRDAAPSTLAFVERTPTTNRYAFFRNGSADSRWAPQPPPALPASCRYLVYGSIALLQEPASERITALVEAHQGRCVTVFDPNMRPSLIDDLDAYRRRFARWLSATDLLKLSDEDAALLAPGLDPAEAARGWLAAGPAVLSPDDPSEVPIAVPSTGPCAVLLTRGAAGATLLRAGHAPLSVAPPPVTLADTIGAGDTFTAGVVVALLERGRDTRAALQALDDAAWAEVLRMGVTAAALNCTREGADPPTRAELAAALGATRGGAQDGALGAVRPAR